MKKLKFVFTWSYKKDRGASINTAFFLFPTFYWWTDTRKPSYVRDVVYLTFTWLWLNIGFKYNRN